MKRIKVLAERAAEGLKDRMAAKDAAALAQRLSGMDQTPDEVAFTVVPQRAGFPLNNASFQWHACFSEYSCWGRHGRLCS